MGSFAPDGVLISGNADDAWAIQKCKRKGVLPVALLTEAELWQNDRLAEASAGGGGGGGGRSVCVLCAERNTLFVRGY